MFRRPKVRKKLFPSLVFEPSLPDWIEVSSLSTIRNIDDDRDLTIKFTMDVMKTASLVSELSKTAS